MYISPRFRKVSEPNVHSFRAALSACERGQQWLLALELREDMARRQVAPDVVTFNATVGQLPWERALKEFERLEKELGANEESYVALVNAMGRGQQWQRRAKRLYIQECRCCFYLQVDFYSINGIEY